MKKYTLLALLLIGGTFATFGQTKKELRKQARIEAKAERVASKLERKLNKVAEKEEIVPEKMAEAKKKVFVGDSLKPITFDQVELYRKDIERGQDDLFSFKFQNTGTKTLIITDVKTSCGCTTAERPNEPIEPGAYSEISVKYDTQRIGNFSKTITIMTNVAEPIFLEIKGNVLDTKIEEKLPEVH